MTPPPPDGDVPSLKQRAALAARLRATIEASFAHWEAVPDLDFDAVFDGYLDEALSAPNRLGFVLANQRLMAQLRNGHTGFADDWVMRRHGRSFGLRLRPLAGQWTATFSRHTDLPIGSVVERIDGAPMAEVFARSRPFLAASNDRAAANSLFFRRHLLPETIVLGLADGREVAVSKADWPPPERPLPAIRIVDGVATLPILAFDDPAFEAAAVAAVASLDRDAPLLIDLRGNGGGNTPQDLLAALMDRPFRSWRSTVLGTTTLNRAHGEKPEQLAFDATDQDPRLDAHRGPLVLVVDGTVASAAEDFAMPFKDNGRALLVGETTEGSSGQPHFIDLGDGFRAWIGAKREAFPDGRTFEGIGIAPDIEIVQTAEDLSKGRDRVLNEAITALAAR